MKSGKWEAKTHADIWNLAERLVLEVRRLLVLASRQVDDNDLIRDIAFLGYQGYAARAGRQRGSVNFECCHV